jgi:hypothetical protein
VQLRFLSEYKYIVCKFLLILGRFHHYDFEVMADVVRCIVFSYVVVVLCSWRITQSSIAIRPSSATLQFPHWMRFGHTTTGQGLHLMTPDPQGAGLKNCPL